MPAKLARGALIVMLLPFAASGSASVLAADEQRVTPSPIVASVVAVWAHPRSGPPTNGSGFIVASDAQESFIVTASHVVAGGDHFSVDLAPGLGRGVPATLVERTEGSAASPIFPDLALLKIERGALKAVHFYPPGADLPRGKDVRAAGYFKLNPITGYQEHETTGHLSATSSDGRVLELDVPLPEGMSGGPLFDPASGAVIGLTESHDKDTVGYGYAASAWLVVDAFLKKYDITVQPSVPGEPAASAPAQAAVVQPTPPLVQSPRPAPAAVRFFRYVVPVAPCRVLYKGEAQPSTRGTVFRVQRDAQNRVVRFSTLRDGKIVSESVNHYTLDSKTPDRTELFNGDQLTGTSEAHRTASNCPDRVDFRAPSGALTSYTLYTYSTDREEITELTASGQVQRRRTRTFGTDHVLDSERLFPPDESKNYEVTFDHETGLPLLRRSYIRGELDSTSKLLYDAGGDLIREDLFNRKDQWWGLAEYSARLITRKFYQFPNETREVRISYDDRRRPAQADFYVNGTLVCIFKPDFAPSGHIVRTLALDGDGRLLAEYPENWVFLVERDGHAVDGFTSTIYKSGSWW